MTEDIRWIQRLGNWTLALNQLARFMEKDDLDELQEQGLIQSLLKKWGERRDLNPRPLEPQSRALPAELRPP